MLCDMCHKKVATIHLTEIVNDNVVEMHICSQCAQEKETEIKKHLDISDLLGGLVDMESAPNEGDLFLHCPQCGLQYEEFRSKGRLGCGECYRAFKNQLLPLLRRIHGTVKHTGKFPKKLDEAVYNEAKIKELRSQLERAVQLEEYEQAACIRDKIKKIMEKHKNKKAK